MRAPSKTSLVLTVLAIAAALVLIATYGTALPASPFEKVKLNNPSAVDSDGTMTAIIDNDSRHVLMLNGEHELTGVIDLQSIDAPFESATDVCVSGGNVYVAGVKYQPDSDIIKLERVVTYGKGGGREDTVYEIAGKDRDTPSIISLDEQRDGVIVSQLHLHDDLPDSTLTFINANSSGAQEIGGSEPTATLPIDIGYSSEAQHYATLSIRGTLNETSFDEPRKFPDRVFTAIDVSDTEDVYACDDRSGALCRIGGDDSVVELVEGKGYDSIHVNSKIVSTCDRQTNEVVLCNLNGSIIARFDAVTPSAGYTMRMVLVWLSGLYLGIGAIVLALRKAHQRVKEGNTDGFGPMFASLAVILAVGLAIDSMSYSAFRVSLQNRANEIGMCADHLITTASSMTSAVEKCNDRDALRSSGESFTQATSNLIEASMPIVSLVDAAGNNGIGMYFNLYGKDSQGIFYIADSGSEHVFGSSVRTHQNERALAEAFESLNDDSTFYAGSTMRDATQFRLVQIPASDGKGVAAVIEIGSKMRSFEAAITADLAGQVLALFVMVLVVYLTYAEMRSCARCLYSYRHMRETQARDAIAVLTRPFTFCVTILSSIDSVMTVLIARELLSKSGMGESSPLLALPAVLLGVGMICGQGLYALCGSRVPLRRLVASGAIIMFFCAIITGATVLIGNFWMYCGAKLLMSVPFGLLYTLGYSLPRIAESPEARATAAGGVKRTDTSAAALGTVLGGYAAQMLGNAWVYALVAIACLPVLVMALNLLPKRSKPLEKRIAPSARLNVKRFVRSRRALAIALFIVLPATVAAGYASFLFPLFSSDLGLSKAHINNIVVLGQVIVFVCIGSIERVEGRFGKWRVTTAAIALLGVVFLLFSVNTTLLWSLVVVALVGLLGKSSDGWKALWLGAAREADVPAGHATSAMFAMRSLALIAQPFIMGALVGMVDSVAVIVIGVLCVACALAFFFSTRNTTIA